MRTVLILILMLFSVQLAASQSRPTAAERMDALDKRTARQAELAPKTGSGGTFVLFPKDVSTISRIKADKIVRSYADSLETSKSALAPFNELLSNKTFKTARLFEYHCDRIDSQSDVKKALCKLLEGEGNTSYFSFRMGFYGSRDLSDIGFVNGEIVTSGYFNQGAIIDIGNVNIDEVTKTTPAVSAIRNLKTVDTVKAFEEYEASLKKGHKVDEYEFRSKVEAKPGHTFIGRFSAYRTDEFVTGYNSSGVRIATDDRRSDIVVVFRVLSIEKDGGPNLIWREISSSSSPKIK